MASGRKDGWVEDCLIFVEDGSDPVRFLGLLPNLPRSLLVGQHSAFKGSRLPGERSGVGCRLVGWGTEVFRDDHEGVIARGVGFSEEQITSEIIPVVVAILRDSAGRHSIEDLLRTLPETSFETVGIRRILEPSIPTELWKVGEAVAEAYLCHESGCSFPWRSSRDLKNPRSSPGGADLVGFAGEGLSVCFAFGEVKTPLAPSAAQRAMYEPGRGLVAQVQTIRDEDQVRRDLIRYLAHRATGAPWASVFQLATQKYLADPTGVAVFGILVGEHSPDPTLVREGTRTLAEGRKPATRIELHVLHFPAGAIARIRQRALVDVGTAS